MKTDGNDLINPAFIDIPGERGYTEPGLTKREYFAAMAMQGLLANSALENGHDVTAEWAVNMADRVIAKLNK